MYWNKHCLFPTPLGKGPPFQPSFVLWKLQKGPRLPGQKQMGTGQRNPQSNRLCLLQKFHGTLLHSSVVNAALVSFWPAGRANGSTVLLLQLCSQNVEPVGKRFLLAVDVSTSLSSIVPGTSVSTAVAAAAISMVCWDTLSQKVFIQTVKSSCSAILCQPTGGSRTESHIQAQLIALSGDLPRLQHVWLKDI